MLNIFKLKFGQHPETRRDAAKSYQRPASISEKLPWMEYDSKNKCFLLDDGRSVGTVFELLDVPSEARPELYLLQLQKGFQSIFQDVFPAYFDEESPWIVQFYLQDDYGSFRNYKHDLRQYIKEHLKNTHYTQQFLSLMDNHIDWMSKPQGIFHDSKVSNLPFRGKCRQIHLVIYRRLTGLAKMRRGRTAAQDLNTVAQTLSVKLEGCGVKIKRCEGKEFYQWMVKWFNPAPRQGEGNADILLERCPYPGDEDMPFGYDFSEKLFFSVPESNQAQGVWYFDKKPHKYLSILGLSSLPKIGHLSLERNFGNYHYSLFDKFPEGSIFQLTVVIQSQEAVKNHIFNIEQSTRRATSTEAEMTREDCAVAKRAIESGNYFYPTTMGVYIRGDNINDLYDKETEIETVLSSNGFVCLNGDHELMPIDSYLRYLPMCYSYEFDKARILRSRYLTAKQIANLLPLYGRERGTQHPTLTFYNRGGEPLTLDPFNSTDKDFNSHLLILGTTGAGKSALVIYFLMLIMAVYRPRLVIVDAGNSFALLGEYFKNLGLTVNRVEISFNNATSLNPFADSEKMLQQIAAKNNQSLAELLEETENEIEQELETLDQDATQTEREANQENRDYLGEMTLAAQLMITGGESKEEAEITRQDRYWILQAVVEAAKAAHRDDRHQMIASDIITAFHRLAANLEANNQLSDQDMIKRLKKMAANMDLFCQDNLSSQYFNTEGSPWPEADVTILEMGLFKEEGYEAQRALAFIGAMNKTISLAEQHQYDERFTLFFGDEIHIITNNPLTAVSVTRCSKMARKIGLWLWFATQNVKDFPNDARKMLSMMEFWICLGMSEAEMAEVERFKTLTEEEKILFRSVRKEAGKYNEGVILCNRIKGLFRNIPPRLSLALAMTEKVEKAERRKMMDQYHCSEIEAAIKMAEKLGTVYNSL